MTSIIPIARSAAHAAKTTISLHGRKKAIESKESRRNQKKSIWNYRKILGSKTINATLVSYCLEIARPEHDLRDYAQKVGLAAIEADKRIDKFRSDPIAFRMVSTLFN